MQSLNAFFKNALNEQERKDEGGNDNNSDAEAERV